LCFSLLPPILAHVACPPLLSSAATELPSSPPSPFLQWSVVINLAMLYHLSCFTPSPAAFHTTTTTTSPCSCPCPCTKFRTDLLKPIHCPPAPPIAPALADVAKVHEFEHALKEHSLLCVLNDHNKYTSPFHLNWLWAHKSACENNQPFLTPY